MVVEQRILGGPPVTLDASQRVVFGSAQDENTKGRVNVAALGEIERSEDAANHKNQPGG
jgi:hypothetical protein